jgi:hypothetical protein
MKIDCTTVDSSIAAGDFFGIRQMVEAQNCTQLAFGNAAAKAVTISFNVSSPKSGAHTLILGNADSSRSYAADYTVAVADTAERISVTIPGDTTGAFAADNGEGLRLIFSLLCGTDNRKTAGSWGAGIYEAGANQQNLLDNTANNFYLGDVQIEIGSVATDFEHEDIGTTLAKCQRYYFDWTATIANEIYGTGQNDNTTQCIWSFNYPTTMRAAPTFDSSAAATFDLAGKGTAINCSAVGSDRLNINNCRIVHSVSSGLTAGETFNIQRDGSDTTFITWSAEL